MSRYDAIVVGAGANGLAAAALLAKRRQRVLVLERSAMAGGTNATVEFHPGFRANACRDEAGWIPPALVRDLDLVRHGLEVTPAAVGLASVSPDEPALVCWPDVARSVEGLRTITPGDAARWSDFCGFVGRAAAFLESMYATRPPRVQSRAAGDLMALARVGRALRAHGKREMMEVLRVVPMPIADVAEEWFRHETLRGMLAVQGTNGVQHGPMSGGTALVFLHQQVGQPAGAIGVRRVVRGGNASLVDALAAAARAGGVEIRLGADVVSLAVRDGKAAGVVLATGEEIAGAQVVSSADPHRSFALVDPKWLDPELLRAVDNVRMRGAIARVHFALDGLPRFESGGREVPRDALAGTLLLATSVAGVERACDEAKYGRMSTATPLTMSIPTLADASLAPTRRHVLSVTVHQVPFALQGGWTAAKGDELADHVTSLLSVVAPDLAERTLHRWVLTPADVEAHYGCTGGSLWHGELALDQFLFMRPVPQCARYATPLDAFWLCGTGCHPASAAGGSGLLAAREMLSRRRS